MRCLSVPSMCVSFLCLAMLAMAPAPTKAEDHSHGQKHQHGHKHGHKQHAAEALQFMDPWTRATPPRAKVAGGYISITNSGPEPDRLIGGSANFAERVEIHEMSMEGGVMKMRPLVHGLAIEPGTTEKLEPGGNHIMFLGLSEGLVEGEERQVTLIFEKAGQVNVVFPVAALGAKSHGMDHAHSHDASSDHEMTGEDKSSDKHHGHKH